MYTTHTHVYIHVHTHVHTHTLPQRSHSLRRLSSSDAVSGSSAATSDQSVTDDLQNHIMLNAPKKGEVDVPLGASITVHFDKDVKTVNINKLFEVLMQFLNIFSLSLSFTF